MPAFLALRAPMSTQKLQPLIWLVRRWTSSSTVCGTPPFLVATRRACMPLFASGSITAGLLIRACIMVLLHVSELHQDTLRSRRSPFLIACRTCSLFDLEGSPMQLFHLELASRSHWVGFPRHYLDATRRAN